MIDNSKYEEILKEGLTLDHYVLLWKVKCGEKLSSSKKVTGFLNLLKKKKFIDESTVTGKAIDLMEKCGQICEPSESERPLTAWALDIYNKCRSELIKLTGKPQMKVRVDLTSPSYSFLPNSMDFTKTLIRVVTLYKVKDLNLVEKVLIDYINKCHREKSWFPLLKYYIHKNNSSSMMNDIENPVEDDKEKKVTGVDI